MTVHERSRLVGLAMMDGAYHKARRFHAPMQSAHEGIAIIREEFDELWVEVKKYPNVNQDALIKEAVHLGAMVLAFLVEIGEV